MEKFLEFVEVTSEIVDETMLLIVVNEPKAGQGFG